MERVQDTFSHIFKKARKHLQFLHICYHLLVDLVSLIYLDTTFKIFFFPKYNLLKYPLANRAMLSK